MTPELIFKNESAEIWHADALDVESAAFVMGDRKADLTLVDAPYSARTHLGHAGGKLTADRAAKFGARSTGNARKRERAYSARKAAQGESGRRDIEYNFWTPADVRKFCDIWVPLTTGWFLSLTDDVLAPAWRTSYVRHDRYPFAPLALIETGSRVRMGGDGPANWACWIVPCRPRGKKYSKWGSLLGGYHQPAERVINSKGGSDRIVGGKPQQSMNALVRDYSLPGELVCDQAVGGGTTALAALTMGRRFIGMDVDRKHAELAARRVEKHARQCVMPWAVSGEKPVLFQSNLFESEAAE